MIPQDKQQVPDFTVFRLYLDKAGIPYTIVHGKPLDPEHCRAVGELILKTEQAHKNSANSTLHLRSVAWPRP